VSTRGCVARKTGESSWKGVYEHFDAYPEGLGDTLWALYHGYFERDLERMLKTLIDDHPAGWSSINEDADWSQAPGFDEHDKGPCAHIGCSQPMWKHYAQYYAAHGLPEPPHPEGNWSCLGHTFEADYSRPRRPQCYCHGDRSEEAWVVTEQNAAGSGVEYAYVFDVEKRQMHVLSSYVPSGGKMVGMFGMGDPKSEWYDISGGIDLDGPEPDWGRIVG
jgi:hypothetical protein